MNRNQRRGLLGVGLAATVVLAWLAPDGEEGGVRASPRRDPSAASGFVETGRPAAPAAVSAGPLRQADRNAPTADMPDLFRSLSWYVPPPPPPPPPPAPPPAPPVPTAPALPFVFLGQLVEDGPPQVMLARGDRVVSVRVGENIDRNYRLESLQGGVLTFVYLPLGTRQTLDTGGPR